MSYKSVLAVVDAVDEADQILGTASVLADRFGARIVGIYAEPEDEAHSVAALDVAYPVQLEAVTARNAGRAKDLEAVFNARAARDAFASEWHHVQGTASGDMDELDRFARSCDLIVVRQPGADDGVARFRRTEHLLFDSGRPVLLVPYIQKEASAVRRALVAWNGTREAARAAFDSLPFLMAADKVEILTVETRSGKERSDLPQGTDLAAALARHGVNVVVTRDVADGQPAGSLIENRLADTGADLLVMGGYSHSRLRERVFGGVTREVLASMTTLTLMSR